MGCTGSKGVKNEKKPEVSAESNVLDWGKLEVRRLKGEGMGKRKLSQRTFSTLFEEDVHEDDVDDDAIESLRRRRAVAKQLHEAAEYAEERSGASSVSKLLEALKEVAPQVLEKRHQRKDEVDELRSSGWPENIEVDESYQGWKPNLTDFCRDDAIALVPLLDKNRDAFAEKVHIKYMLITVLKFLDQVRTQASVVHVSTALTNGKCVVVGDLHGQLDDLLCIFRGVGYPSFDRPFIFNGDIVDRGPSSLEILLIIAAFMIAEPYSVYVNRGNHEDFGVCGVYTFTRELETKYPGAEENKRLHQVIEQIFAYLPVACVIDHNIFVVHGGLSDKVRDLDHLANIQRGGYKSLMTPALKGLFFSHKPSSSAAHSPTAANGQKFSVHDVLKDCLWSDPLADDSKHTQCIPNDTRGAGVKFPKELTKKWLKANKLGVLLRSHQCVDHGYEIQHDGKCLTLFSASNYYGHEHNDGAILILDLLSHKNGGYIGTYNVTNAQIHSAEHDDLLLEEQSISAFEKSGLTRIHRTLLDHRRELVDAFEMYDPEHTGIISLDDWDKVMRATVPGLEALPWRDLAPQFARTQDENSVRYRHLLNSLRRSLRKSFTSNAGTSPSSYKSGHLFLPTTSLSSETEENEQQRLSVGERPSNGDSLAEDVYRYRHELNLLFTVLDVDASGTLNRQDLLCSVEILNKINAKSDSSLKRRKFTKQDVDKLFRFLDVDGNGSITFAEFAATLAHTDSTLSDVRSSISSSSPPGSPSRGSSVRASSNALTT